MDVLGEGAGSKIGQGLLGENGQGLLAEKQLNLQLDCREEDVVHMPLSVPHLSPPGDFSYDWVIQKVKDTQEYVRDLRNN